jgi:hypothetical protein
MKKETAAAKFEALFGIKEQVEEVKIKSTGKIIGVTEEEIQKYREAQGLWYFLQAPALFTMKKCKRENCGEIFAVSRKYVAFCSYDCLRLDLKDQGIDWNRSRNYDIELLVQDPDVYDGNEPIWIRESVLKKLEEMVLLRENPTTSSTPLVTPKSDPEPSLESPRTTEPLPTSSTDSTTPSPPANSKPTIKKKKTARTITFRAS